MNGFRVDEFNETKHVTLRNLKNSDRNSCDNVYEQIVFPIVISEPVAYGEQRFHFSLQRVLGARRPHLSVA